VREVWDLISTIAGRFGEIFGEPVDSGDLVAALKIDRLKYLRRSGSRTVGRRASGDSNQG